MFEVLYSNAFFSDFGKRVWLNILKKAELLLNKKLVCRKRRFIEAEQIPMKIAFSRQIKKAWLLLLCLAAPPQIVFGLDPNRAFSQYKQTVWNTENGLPVNIVLAIRQTRDGYLWFGTQEGLARFNGVSFKIFDAANTPTLKNAYIGALIEDRSGNLWIGTSKGLHLYRDGEFTAYTTENGLSKNFVTALYEDRAGDLWIGTSGGLNRLSRGKFTVYGKAEGINNERIRAIGEDADGNLWIGTADGLYRRRDNEFRAFTVADGLASNQIRAIYSDSQRNLWIGTDNGLSKLDGERFAIDVRFAGKVVRAITGDSENTLWVGGDFGLSRLVGDDSILIEGGKAMPPGGVYAVSEDHEGNLWFSTEGDGLRQVTDGKFATFTPAENLSGNIAFSIAQNPAGEIWIGTEKGVSRFWRNEFDLSLLKQKELPNDRVVSVLSDGANDLWIGTTDGLRRWQNNRLTVPRNGEVLGKKLVQALYRDRENNLLIGTNGGLYRLENEQSAGEIVDYKRFEPLANANIYVVHGNLKDGLWIGAAQGLFFLKDDNLIKYTVENGLGSNTVMSLFEDASGALWIGTFGGGLSRFKNGEFKTVTVKDGLFNATVYSILPDDANNLWMSCNRGVFRVSKQQIEDFWDGKRKTVDSIVYGTADGMRTFDCNGGFQPAALRARDGKLWFPTAKGAAVIDPNRIRLNERVPPVKLENVIADDAALTTFENANLAAGTHRLEFRFAALTFVAPEKTRFRYRLEGYDADWIEAGNRREAFYTNLPHGDYRFRVIAANNDGLWNETGDSFALRINPFFYQTWWFTFLCFGAIGGLTAAAHFLRVQQLQLRHQAVLDERTRIARELHDTLLQGFVGVSSQLGAVAQQFQTAPEIAERHLAVARKMIRHSVTESRRAVQDLRAADFSGASFNEQLRETARRVLENQSPAFIFETHGTEFKIEPETVHHLLRIIEEAATNAVKHAAAKTLKIIVKYNRPAVRLEIVDDGRGFIIENAFSALNNHFGLLGMNERAEKAGGKLVVETAPAGGTKIVFQTDSAAANSNRADKPNLAKGINLIEK